MPIHQALATPAHNLAAPPRRLSLACEAFGATPGRLAASPVGAPRLDREARLAESFRASASRAGTTDHCSKRRRLDADKRTDSTASATDHVLDAPSSPGAHAEAVWDRESGILFRRDRRAPRHLWLGDLALTGREGMADLWPRLEAQGWKQEQSTGVWRSRVVPPPPAPEDSRLFAGDEFLEEAVRDAATRVRAGAGILVPATPELPSLPPTLSQRDALLRLENAEASLSATAWAKDLEGNALTTTPGRELEVARLRGFLAARGEGRPLPGALYLSGQPGTGKTRSVHRAVRLHEQQDPSQHRHIYVDATWFSHCPTHFFNYVCSSLAAADQPHREHLLRSDSMDWRRSVAYLGDFFAKPRGTMIAAPDRKRHVASCRLVLVIDEFDQWLTGRHSAEAVACLFQWAALPNDDHHNALTLLTMANSIDVPPALREALAARKLPMPENMVFRTYDVEQLRRIVSSRIGHGFFHPKALELLLNRVGQRSGDARRALDVSRRVLESVRLGLRKQSETEPVATPLASFRHVNEVWSQLPGHKRKVDEVSALPIQSRVVLCILAFAVQQHHEPHQHQQQTGASSSVPFAALQRSREVVHQHLSAQVAGDGDTSGPGSLSDELHHLDVGGFVELAIKSPSASSRHRRGARPSGKIHAVSLTSVDPAQILAAAETNPVLSSVLRVLEASQQQTAGLTG